MKCKDCVHYKLCRDLFCQIDILSDSDKECDYFEQYKPEPPTIAFLCKDKGTEYCHHTKHIEQARNFEKVGPNQWMEKEPKRGEWIPCKDDNFFECSKCQQIVMSEERSNFCPNCGADMREGEAE